MKVKDKDKTKEQLIDELASLRQRTAEPEAAETERKRMEDELTRHRQHLEALVEERTAELEASNEQLQHELAERKQAEEELRESEERYRSLYSAMSEGICLHDVIYDGSGKAVDYVIQEINSAYEFILGLKREEVVGSKASEAYGAGEPPYLDVYAEVASSGQPTSFETYFPPMDKHFQISVFSPGKGKFATVFSDITERKQAEEVLRQSEERYRTILESVEDGYFEVDIAGNFTFFNKALQRILGYPAEELMGMNSRTYSVGEDAKRVYKAFNEVYGTGKPMQGFSWQILRKDGSTRFLETSASLIRDPEGNPIGFRGVSRDITERKQAEEALGRSEERYRTILEQIQDSYFELDLAGNVTFFNNTMCRDLGYSRQELLGMNYQAYIAAEDVEAVFRVSNKTYRTGRTGRTPSFKFVRKDGSTGFGETWLSPLRNEAGEIIGFRGLSRDITERKQAEDALRQSEERYRTILEQMEDSYFEVDLGGHMTFANDSTCLNLRHPREELLGKSYKSFSAEKDFDAVYKAFNKVYQTGNLLKGLCWEVVRGDGSAGFSEATVLPLYSQDGQIIGLRGIGRDITERKQMEKEKKELEQKAHMASRLASVGLLASGVGHEINNPLTGVIGYAQLLLGRDVPEDIKKDLRAINKEAQRVANIVKKLVAFARYQKPQRAYAGISDIVASTVDLLAHQLETSNIQTNLRLDPNLPWTIADIGQLQQVFLNIIINAETEMRLAHGKGKLSIKTEKADNTIRVSFQDNGPGIAKENLQKIFDPFFTTREVGEGTGLGLSICHEIITEHGGTIHVQSEAGKGATFIVELPVVTEQVEPELAEPSVEEPAKVPGARVLVVDDEPVILDFVSRVLTDEGHEVETVDNAADALKKIKSERYGLILLDIKMPGMRGDDLYKRIQRIAGSLARRVVFITGDVMGAETIDFLDRTEAPYVAKPFDAEELKKAINRILAGDA